MKSMQRLMPLFALTLAAGCVQTDPCGWAAPIMPSRADVLTDGTARQILTYNETGARICGWQP